MNEKYKPITSAIGKLIEKKTPERYGKFPHFMDHGSYDDHLRDTASEHIYDSVADTDTDNESMASEVWTESSDELESEVERENVDTEVVGPSGLAEKRQGDDVLIEPGSTKKKKYEYTPGLRALQAYLKKKAERKGRKKTVSKKKHRIIRPRSDAEDDSVGIVEKRHKKSPLTRSEKFRMNDLQRTRDIRKDVAQRQKEVADSQIPHFQEIPDNNIIELSDEHDYDGGEGDNDDVVIVGRTPSTKRKAAESSQSQSSRKFVAVAKIPADRKKKFLNYAGVKKISPNLLLHSTRKRMNIQKTPYYSGRVPSIDRPFLTREHILHRSLIPPIPSNRPALQKITTIVAKKNSKTKSDEEKKGSGLESDFIPYKENTNYEFYDDANQLCDRLRLLVASRVAGNTNHAHEINSIISELRESKYIL